MFRIAVSVYVCLIFLVGCTSITLRYFDFNFKEAQCHDTIKCKNTKADEVVEKIEDGVEADKVLSWKSNDFSVKTHSS